MYGIGWKHRVSRPVMIELLYAEGLRWAGWYQDANLIGQWDRIMGQHNVGVFRGEKRKAAVAAWNATYPDPPRKAKPKTKGTKAGQFTSWQELEKWLDR